MFECSGDDERLAGEDAGNIRLAGFDYTMLAGLAVLIVVILVRAAQDIRSIEDTPLFSAFGREIHPNSIAVLPLDNLTGYDDQAYLVAGIHEAITSTLSGIGALHVKSRTSTASYKGSDL